MTDAATMEECSLADLFNLLFQKLRTTNPWAQLPTMGWTFPHKSSIEKMQHRFP